MRHVLMPLLALALIVPATALTVFAEDPAPKEAPSAAEIAELVKQLGHDDFKVRERASRALAKLGEKARSQLEDASRESKSLEARWRAQQLLRRLDGTKAKPVDGTPPAPDRNRGELEDGTEVERLKRLMDEWRKKLEGSMGRRGMDPFGGTMFPLGKVKAPGLELVRTLRGVKLTVIDENATGPEARKTYEGRSLDAILAEHPELKDHKSMAELKAKDVDPFKRLKEMLGGTIRIAPGRGGFSSVMSSNGVEIRQDADGATVKITEKDENGNPVTKTYKGKTLEEIKAKHPELKEKLKNGPITFEWNIGKPRILRPGDTDEWLKRFRPTTPSRKAPAKAESVFGVWVETPDSLLTMHLGLAEGHGGLVRKVEAGSQAESMGIERGDIIVTVNGVTITSRGQLVDLLRQAAQAGGGLKLEIIRRGERQTLTR